MKKKNLKPFFPLGFCFTGVGVVFLSAVNRGLGVAFIGLGIIYMIIGGDVIRKQKKER